MASDEERIGLLYQRFNARDIEGVLEYLARDVAWANGMEGTHIHGLAALREYWTYQWTVIDPNVTPLQYRKAADGVIVVTVHQIVHDLTGKLLLDEVIEHVFYLENGIVHRFDIQGNSQLSNISH